MCLSSPVLKPSMKLAAATKDGGMLHSRMNHGVDIVESAGRGSSCHVGSDQVWLGWNGYRVINYPLQHGDLYIISLLQRYCKLSQDRLSCLVVTLLVRL